MKMEQTGAPALYANIPITNIKNDILVEKKKEAEKVKDEINKEEGENGIIQEIEETLNLNQGNNIENQEVKNEPIPETVNQN